MPEIEANPKVNIAPGPAPSPAPAAAPAKGGRRFFGILIGAAVLVVVALAIWIGYKALSIGPTPSPNSSVVINNPQTTADIKNDSDLQQLENEVNNTALDSLTKDLDQNDTDASGF